RGSERHHREIGAPDTERDHAHEETEQGRRDDPDQGARGNVTPTLVARWEMTRPATPESASCIAETWPRNPVTITSESARTAAIAELTSDWRKSYGSTINAALK